MSKTSTFVTHALAGLRIAAVVAPVPGLSLAVDVLDGIYQAVLQIQSNRYECEDLADRCAETLNAIKQYAEGQEASNIAIADALAKTTLILQTIRASMTKWGEYNRTKAYLKKDKITEKLGEYRLSLDQCIANFNFMSHLVQHQWNVRADQARAADHALQVELLKVILSENQDIKAQGQEHFEKLMSRLDNLEVLQREMRNYRPNTEAHSIVSSAVYGLLRQSGGRPLPDVKLLGHECRRTSEAPIAGTHMYDIFLGLWLGHEKVALKTLRNVSTSQKALDRFTRQIDIWSQLNSKYILRTYGIAPVEGMPNQMYIVSPYLENGDVCRYLKTHHNADRLRILLDVAYGLRILHSLNPPIVHGNLQGSNVLIDDHGGAILSDFGFSKALEDFTEIPFTQTTNAGNYVRWMAPEQIGGEDDEQNPMMSKKSDIYSWGMTALQILTGKEPFFKVTRSAAVVVKIYRGLEPVRADYDTPETPVGDRLWELLQWCWRRNRDERPTIEQVVVELESIKAETAASAFHSTR